MFAWDDIMTSKGWLVTPMTMHLPQGHPTLLLYFSVEVTEIRKKNVNRIVTKHCLCIPCSKQPSCVPV
jgi:hypothetical protein